MWTPQHPADKKLSPSLQLEPGKTVFSGQILPFFPRSPGLTLSSRPVSQEPALTISHPTGPALPATSPLSSSAMVPAPYVVPFSLETKFICGCIYMFMCISVCMNASFRVFLHMWYLPTNVHIFMCVHLSLYVCAHVYWLHFCGSDHG